MPSLPLTPSPDPSPSSAHELFDTLFQHLPAVKVIVCTACDEAVLPSTMDEHLRNDKHRGVLGYQRKAVVATLNTIDPQTLARDPQDVVLPPPTDPPLASLKVKSNGVACDWTSPLGGRCRAVFETRTTVKKHLAYEHG